MRLRRVTLVDVARNCQQDDNERNAPLYEWDRDRLNNVKAMMEQRRQARNNGLIEDVKEVSKNIQKELRKQLKATKRHN